MPSPPPARTRRVQQRALDTRRLLLDTTIEVLLADGYAGLTTRRVGDRAGVSRGRQMHHFPTRASLVIAALDYLVEAYTADLLRRRAAEPGGDPVVRALDLMWEVHTGPLFRAAVEVLVGAKSDPELRDALVEFERRTTRVTLERGGELLGAAALAPDFAESLHTALAAMRGLALAAFVFPGTGEEFAEIWGKTRDRLRTLFPQTKAQT